MARLLSYMDVRQGFEVRGETVPFRGIGAPFLPYGAPTPRLMALLNGIIANASHPLTLCQSHIVRQLLASAEPLPMTSQSENMTILGVSTS